MSRTVTYDYKGEEIDSTAWDGIDVVCDVDISEEDLDELDKLVAENMPDDIYEDPKMHTRKTILSEAERVICNDRQDQYGNAEDSFQLIANFWNLYLYKKLDDTNPITPYDVARMMTLLKLARSMSNPMHQDNDIDICGYTAIAAELAYEEWAGEHHS